MVSAVTVKARSTLNLESHQSILTDSEKRWKKKDTSSRLDFVLLVNDHCETINAVALT